MNQHIIYKQLQLFKLIIDALGLTDKNIRTGYIALYPAIESLHDITTIRYTVQCHIGIWIPPFEFMKPPTVRYVSEKASPLDIYGVIVRTVKDSGGVIPEHVASEILATVERKCV